MRGDLWGRGDFSQENLSQKKTEENGFWEAGKLTKLTPIIFKT